MAKTTLWGALGMTRPKTNKTYTSVETPTTPDYSMNPIAPDWLTQFVPGLTAWEHMQPLPIKVASGQQWNRTPSSHKAGIESYINWASGQVGGIVASYQDYVDAILGMLPQRSPSRPGYWSPMSQG
jgi:hypothetical protein